MTVAAFVNSDRLREKGLSAVLVIPAEAGIQVFQGFLDLGFHRGDEIRTF